MTFAEADRLFHELGTLRPRLRISMLQERNTDNWYIMVQEPGADQIIRLPDVLSVRAYLDARRGYRTEAGAPDFGPGRV